jgi:hypothetical protein
MTLSLVVDMSLALFDLNFISMASPHIGWNEI